MDEVDFTILAATSVLGDLVEKCPPAAACRDAFQRMSRATVQMCLGGGTPGSGVTISTAVGGDSSPNDMYANTPARRSSDEHPQHPQHHDLVFEI